MHTWGQGAVEGERGGGGRKVSGGEEMERIGLHSKICKHKLL